MAYLDAVDAHLLQHTQPAPSSSYSTPNQHPPTAHPTSTLLQHTQPAPSYSTPNQHPPTAHPTSTLLQHTQPAPSYSTPNQHPPTAHPTSTLLQCTCSLCNSVRVCAHTVYVSCEYPHYICTYVCACAPVPHAIIVFKQFACLIYSLAHMQYMQAYRQRYCKYVICKAMQTHKRQKHAATQHT